MWNYVILAVFMTPVLAYSQVYKCISSDGKVSFANVPCTTPEGVSEIVNTQTNQIGTFATPEQVRETEYARSNPSSSTMKVTVVPDPRAEDPSTLGGLINRRLREKEEAIARKRKENPSGVTVVHDSSRESQAARAVRLRREAREVGLTSSPRATTSSQPDYAPPEINDREVHYNPNQSPLDRRLKQIENKMNDPRPQDGSREACRARKPKRGIVRIGQKEIWQGMTSSEVRSAIGSPSSVNSLIVGTEQWVYHLADNRSLFVYIKGQCVSSIQ